MSYLIIDKTSRRGYMLSIGEDTCFVADEGGKSLDRGIINFVEQSGYTLTKEEYLDVMNEAEWKLSGTSKKLRFVLRKKESEAEKEDDTDKQRA